MGAGFLLVLSYLGADLPGARGLSLGTSHGDHDDCRGCGTRTCGPEDVAKWEEGGQKLHSSPLSDCGADVSSADKVKGCVQEKGYSTSCSVCFGDLARCKSESCMQPQQCFGELPESGGMPFLLLTSQSGKTNGKCKECLQNNCIDSFTNCTGFSANLEG